MSKGPGRTQRRIMAAFTAFPDRAFTIAELVVVAYGFDAKGFAFEATARAARGAAKRLGWVVQHVRQYRNPNRTYYISPARAAAEEAEREAKLAAKISAQKASAVQL